MRLKHALCFYILFIQALTSEEIKLAQVIVEPQNNAVHELLLHLDDTKTVTSLIRKTTSSEARYSTAALKAGDVVLAKVKGKNVISMTCPNYEESSGGIITVKYLYNGLTMSYYAVALELVKEEETWALYTTTPEKKRIQTLTLKPRRLAGLLIGIQSIELL